MAKLQHCLYFLDKKVILEEDRIYQLGRDPEGEIVLPDQTVSRRHARIRPEGGGFAIEDLGSTNGVFVNYQRVESKALADKDRILIGPFILVFRTFEAQSSSIPDYDEIMSDTLIIENRLSKLIDEVKDHDIRTQILNLKRLMNRSKKRMSNLANRDRLTNLFNRRFFDESLDGEIERAKRYGLSVCLIMVDIDHFKKVNDTHGHRKGDEVLTAVAAILAENTRVSDVVARYGGEEMAVILPEIGLEKAARAAEKLRRQVEVESKRRADLQVTVSVGVAAYRPGLTASELIERTDQALYQAKKMGRNRVIVHQV